MAKASRGMRTPVEVSTWVSVIAAKRPVPTSVRFGEHVDDAEVIPHDLGGYDG